MNKKYVNHLGRRHQIIRLVWNCAWALLCRWLPRSAGSGWKRFVLRSFGARIAPTAVIYSTAKIYYPANLVMDDYACLASDVDCYNVATVKVGRFATHDIDSETHELITAPIVIGDNAWIGVRAYVGMGVEIGEGAVVGATASVYKSVNPWEVVGGTPAKFIKKRMLGNA